MSTSSPRVPPPSSEEVSAESDGPQLGRRQFIRASAASTALGFLPGFGFVGCLRTSATTDGVPIDPRFMSPIGTSQFDGGFYIEFFNGRHTYRPQGLQLEDWTLRIRQTVDGESSEGIELNFQEIVDSFPADEETFFQTFQCVGYEPGSSLVSNGYFTGVPLRKYLEKAGVDFDKAKRVIFRCFDGYASNHLISRVLNDDPPLYLAYGVDGVPFDRANDGSLAHGYPVRIVCPEMMGMKSPKALVEIEVVDVDDVVGHWEQIFIDDKFPGLTWGDQPLTKINSKIFGPVEYQEVVADTTFTVKGTAWSGRAPLRKVEIGIHQEGGSEADIVWTDAVITPPTAITVADQPDYDDSDGTAFAQAMAGVLAADKNPFIWSLWQADISLPTGARFHRIFARAMDADGKRQPFEFGLPESRDGTNAIHSVLVQRAGS